MRRAGRGAKAASSTGSAAHAGASGQRGRFDWTVGGQHVADGQRAAQQRVRAERGGAASGGCHGAGHGPAPGAPRRGRRARHAGPDRLRPARPRRRRSSGDASWPPRTCAMRADRSTHHLRAGYASTDALSLNPLDSGPYMPRWEDLTAPFAFFDFAEPARLPERHLAAERRLPARGAGRATPPARRRRGRRARGGRAGLARGADCSTRTAPTPASTCRTGWSWASRLFATLGGRLEHNDSFGTRGGAARRPRLPRAGRRRPAHAARERGRGREGAELLRVVRRLVLRQGNPDLRPERSRTYDLGLEQRLFGDRLRAEAARLPPRVPRPDRLTSRGPHDVPGLLHEPRAARARAGWSWRSEASPTAGLCACPRSTRCSTARCWRAATPSTAGLRGGRGRCCAGRSTRARSRRALANGARRCWAPTSSWSAGARTATSRAWASRRTRATRASTRARACAVARGFEVLVVGENLFDEEYQEVLGYPALGRDRARRACATAAGPAADEPPADPARLEQRQGQRVEPPRPSRQREDVEVVGLLTTVNAGARPRGDARGAARAAAGAGARRPACRSSIVRIPSPCSNDAVRGRHGGGDRRRPGAAASRASRSATCSWRTSAATASGRWRRPASSLLFPLWQRPDGSARARR